MDSYRTPTIDETEFLQLVFAEAIIPNEELVENYVEDVELLRYYQLNQVLPKSLVEKKLIETIGFPEISEETKDRFLNQLRLKQIMLNAAEGKDANLSFIATKAVSLCPLSEELDDLLSNMPEYIPTGISELDLALGGGLLEQSYNLILAETNIGKTTIMLNLALNAMRRNESVIYLTFEETKNAILSRLVQNILKIKMPDVHKINDYQKNLVKVIIKNITVISEPSGSISTTDFFKLIESHEHSFIFIDYYTHFKKHPKNDVLQELTKISTDLSNYAKQNDKIVWSAAQARRESFGKKPSLADAGASIDSVRLADVVIGASKGESLNDGTENKYQVNMNILKDRQGANRSLDVSVMLNVNHQQLESDTIIFEQPEPKQKTKQQKKNYIMDADDETKNATLAMFSKRGIK